MIKILFEGDSITDGNRYKEEEKRWDKNHQIGHSWAYIVTASLGYRYPGAFSFVNRAYSGFTVAELNERWEEDVVREAPDMLFLLVGTNDAGRNAKSVCDFACADYERGYRRLLERTRAARPDAGLVLLEPFHALDDENRIRCLDRNREIVRALADEFRAVFIPLQAEFDRVAASSPPGYWIWDGIHPTEAGHGLIAAQVLARVEPLLKEALCRGAGTPDPAGVLTI